MAHHLTPVVFIGQQGLTRSVISKTEEGLLSHELIKVRFTDYKDEKSSLADALATATDSMLVDIIGHIAILYRPHPDMEHRKINI